MLTRMEHLILEVYTSLVNVRGNACKFYAKIVKIYPTFSKFSPPQVAKMSVTNAKMSVTKFASKCHKL